MKDKYNHDLGFTFKEHKNGDVIISRLGTQITKLSSGKATGFIDEMENNSFAKQQQIMARMTGNYRRGSERQAKNHTRNQY